MDHKKTKDKIIFLEKCCAHLEEKNKKFNVLLKGKSKISTFQFALENDVEKLTTKLQATTEKSNILQENLEKG